MATSTTQAQNFVYSVHQNTNGGYLFGESAWKLESFLCMGIFRSKIRKLNLSKSLEQDTAKLGEIEKSFHRVEGCGFLDSKEGVLSGTSISTDADGKLILYRYYVTRTHEGKMVVSFLMKITFSGHDVNVEMRNPIIENIEILEGQDDKFDERLASKIYLEAVEQRREADPPPPPPITD